MTTPTLTTHDGVTATRKWLGLGNKIEAKTVEEALTQGGLDFSVSKRPIATTSAIPKLDRGNPRLLDSNGTERIGHLRYHLARLLRHPSDPNISAEVEEILKETEDAYIPHTEHFAIVRNDTNQPFGVLGRIYECLQNEECIQMLAPLLADGRITIERAGTFNDGANCWVIAKFPKSITIGTDVLDQYMKVSWSHDGTEKLSATFIALLRRTNTQINPPVKGSHVSIEIRHTTNAPERIGMAKTLLDKGETYFEKLEEVLAELVSAPWTDREMEEYLEALIPDGKNVVPDPKTGVVPQSRASMSRDKVLEIFQDTDPDVGHTKYAAFGAVAQWCEHEKTVRVTGKDKAGDDEAKLKSMANEARLRSNWMKSGTARKMKNEAFSLIVK